MMMTKTQPAGIVTYQAVHPHWNGSLRLDFASKRLKLEEYGSTASFQFDGKILHVEWDVYPKETFKLVDGVLFQSGLNQQGFFPPEWELTTAGVVVRVPQTSYLAELRLGESDIATFGQVFVHREYDTPSLPDQAPIIFDLGANIGLASLYFAHRYPEARIVALEPEASNFLVMMRNLVQLGSRVQPFNAAIWHEDTELQMKTHADTGEYLSAWGGQTVAIDPSATRREFEMTKALSMPSLMKATGVDHIDILKIDVEGAELELFSKGSRSWLDAVGMVLVETHDRFRPGSHQAVLDALSEGFKQAPASGENLVFIHT
jgi:FkbM family methyltransferase